jgi:hypothetical protein
VVFESPCSGPMCLKPVGDIWAEATRVQSEHTKTITTKNSGEAALFLNANDILLAMLPVI